MPANHNNERLGTEWMKDATSQWGILLHPLGEMAIVDFIMEKPDDITLMQARLAGMQFQVALIVLFWCVFANNLYVSSKLVISRPRALTGWCCLIPSILGAVYCTLVTLMLSPYPVTCRAVVWYIAVAMSISLVCNSIIVLRKAYLASRRQLWVIIVGAILTIPQVGFAYISFKYDVYTLETHAGCVNNYPSFIPWYWFGAVAPVNVLFSSVFSYVAYKQYRLFGSDAWRRLARDGIQTMFLVVACNVICGLILIFEVGGDLSETAFMTDW
jgi:hypothetical protein